MIKRKYCFNISTRTSQLMTTFLTSSFLWQNGVIFGPFFIMPFTVFSGFFLRYSDAPFFFRWLFNLSFLKHGLVGLMIAIFGMDRSKLDCNELYCHYTYPSQFLKDNDVASEKYTYVVAYLTGIASFFIVCSYAILRIRMKSKWWTSWMVKQ